MKLQRRFASRLGKSPADFSGNFASLKVVVDFTRCIYPGSFLGAQCVCESKMVFVCAV